MLKISLKKIKSAPSLLLLFLVIGVGLLTLLLTFFWLQQGDQSSNIVKFGDTRYRLKMVTSATDQAKGLGGRPGMPKDHGMLFSYSDQDERCFWMKDMRFDLDIIWVDAYKHVTHIEKGLKPQTYPKLYCANAQYVIELNAGEVARSGLKTGKAVEL